MFSTEEESPITWTDISSTPMDRSGSPKRSSLSMSSSSTTSPDFAYIVPDRNELHKYMEYINMMPEKDSPQVFGLNPSAEMSFRLAESSAMLNVLIDTMPKDSGSAGGKTKEEEVREKCDELLKQLPNSFIEIEVKEALARAQCPRGLDPTKNIPLNIFLRQEIEQF